MTVDLHGHGHFTIPVGLLRRISESLLRRMATNLDPEDRDEMAIPSYLHSNPAMRWMAWRRLEVLAKQLDKVVAEREAVDRIVDFGCGTGVLLGECSAHASSVTGVDLVVQSAELLVKEWSLPNVEICLPDHADTIIEDGSIDIIVAAEVLEHVEPLTEAFARFDRWLKPDGVLLTSLPTENRLYRLGRRLAGFSGHYHHANASSIDKDLTSYGFKRTHLQTIPAPGPLAIYWVSEYRR